VSDEDKEQLKKVLWGELRNEYYNFGKAYEVFCMALEKFSQLNAGQEKGEAIAFAEWLGLNDQYVLLRKVKMWRDISEIDSGRISTSKLYELFTQSLTDKT
jgi:hypothetical protein